MSFSSLIILEREGPYSLLQRDISRLGIDGNQGHLEFAEREGGNLVFVTMMISELFTKLELVDIPENVSKDERNTQCLVMVIITTTILFFSFSFRA